MFSLGAGLGLEPQVRVLVVTKKEGLPPKTHATVYYNPNLPSDEVAEDEDLVDPSSQPA